MPSVKAVRKTRKTAIFRVEDLHTWFEVRRMGFIKVGMCGPWTE